MASAYLRCPRCGVECAWHAAAHADDRVRCASCSAQFEFRQMHEAWCVNHRAALLRAFPDLPEWAGRAP